MKIIPTLDGNLVVDRPTARMRARIAPSDLQRVHGGWIILNAEAYDDIEPIRAAIADWQKQCTHPVFAGVPQTVRSPRDPGDEQARDRMPATQARAPQQYAFVFDLHRE